ncbi:dipeptide/oligopeptide/nickel ABC transporter permease/ATP-binding protein [Methylopila sp. Yamaguchi]|uniref:dipeptide/oligopeptide/nickel ABC transporter permease/ATP-binding protein n=1 Tax=Methylopila sp. Yamaguchi TaxID=1437817 RepID=UPI000CBC7CB2|nr:dipeptide/oligopeptide/nickel ABC transporter permease/ATP-binding protein [Methylopila sp. Yamaguchi]GBD49709.1 dipeptide/oligopeptide/nickel ABC transporter ATPase [Methylopila sp. Yamaguchi]
MSVLVRLARQPFALAGLALVAVFAALALAAPLLPLPDPDATEPANRLAALGAAGHLLGTDQLGRDVLARLIFGLRVSLAVGVAATLAAALVGGTVGLVAAFYGRWVDGLLMRLVDVLMAFPYLLLALAVVAALGPGLTNAALAIAIVNVPFFARAVRGQALGIVRQDYVAAARLAGFSDLRILLSEVLPNVAPLLIVTAATTIGWMILETAGLSFLGLGAQPPQADLGSMLGDGHKVVVAAPHVAAAPGVVVFVLVVGLNLLGDGLRDALDPRMKGVESGAPQPATRVERGMTGAGSGPNDSAAVLDVRALTTAFATPRGSFPAIRDVSFTLQAGEALGIVGESGSGKSVTALSLARLAPTPPGTIVSGEVRIGGADVLGLGLDRLRRLRGDRIAYVFQDPLTTLNPLMRIEAQIVEAIRPAPGEGAKAVRTRASALMADVGLPDPERIARAYPHELSGGQRQRVGVAMALANAPDVLVADEPTTALDATTQGRILELFARIRRERGAALIFVSHDVGVVACLCDRIVVMYAGEIVEEGPARVVAARPLHPYAARLIACAPRLGQPDKSLAPIPGAPPAIDARPDGCAFAPRCDHAVAACRAGPIGLEEAMEGRRVRCIRWRELSGEAA